MVYHINLTPVIPHAKKKAMERQRGELPEFQEKEEESMVSIMLFLGIVIVFMVVGLAL